MKIVHEYDHSQRGMVTKFYVDIYGKKQYFLIKALLNFIPFCDPLSKIHKLIRFFMLNPLFCSNGEICIQSLVHNTFENEDDFKKKITGEDDFKELFLNMLNIFNDNVKNQGLLFIESINDLCGQGSTYFTEDDIRCTLTYLVCQDRELLKKDFSKEVIDILGEPYDLFFEELVKTYAKKVDEAKNNSARFEAFQEYYNILK